MYTYSTPPAPPAEPYLNKTHERRHARPSSDHDDPLGAPFHHGAERLYVVIEAVHVDQQRLRRGNGRGSIGHAAQSLRPRAEVLHVHRKYVFLRESLDLLGEGKRRGAAEGDGDGVRLVRAERGWDAEVYEGAPPRGLSLGVF